MSDKKTSDKKCSLKCKTCEYYNFVGDFCTEKGIKHCSQQTHTDFSTCDSYLVSERLVMF
jgi:hypothetical protein